MKNVGWKNLLRIKQMGLSKLETRAFWPDMIKVLSIFGVILTQLLLWSRAGNYPVKNNLVVDFSSNLLFSLLFISVPLFFMSSAYFLIHKKETLGEFFSKRWGKLFALFLFWSFCYLLIMIHVQGQGVDFFHAAKQILEGTILPHFWLFYVLLGFYILVPVLRVILQNAEQKDLRYFLGLWFLFASLNLFSDRFLNFRLGFEVPFATGVAGYYCLGYYVQQLKLSGKAYFFNGIIFVLAFLATFFGTAALSGGGKTDNYFYTAISPSMILLSMTSFLFLKSLFEKITYQKKTLFKKIVFSISRLYLGIYALQTVFVLFFAGELGHFQELPLGLVLPLAALLILVLSFLLCLLLYKIPLAQIMLFLALAVFLFYSILSGFSLSKERKQGQISLMPLIVPPYSSNSDTSEEIPGCDLKPEKRSENCQGDDPLKDAQ